MTAVILAAGRGNRLRQIVGARPKCLARVGDCTLLERQLRTLRDFAVERTVVVAGYHAPEVHRVCGPGVQIVTNERFAATNSLYSLWLARDLLADGFLVLNCDVLFHPQLLADLLTARYEDALLMSARSDAEPYGDEEMKVEVRAGRVTAIAKTLDPTTADGENVGIAKFGRQGAALLIGEMGAVVASGGLREWLPRAFDGFCRRRPLHVVDTRGFPWIEIDSPEDYWRACSDVLPAIEAAAGSWDARPVAPRHAAAERSRRTHHHV